MPASLTDTLTAIRDELTNEKSGNPNMLAPDSQRAAVAALAVVAQIRSEAQAIVSPPEMHDDEFPEHCHDRARAILALTGGNA